MIYNISLATVNPNNGDNVIVTATLKNVGILTQPQGQIIKFYIDGNQDSILQTSVDLAPDGTYPVSFNWTAVEGCHVLKIQSYLTGDENLDNDFDTIAVSIGPATWNGSINRYWNNPRNWSCNALPGSNSTIYISGSISNQPILTKDDTCFKLILNPGSELLINPGKKLTVCDSLILEQGSNDDPTNLIIKGEVWVNVGSLPITPYNPFPPDNSTNQDLIITLSWQSSDPDGDPLTFDVYIDTISYPTILIASDISSFSYQISDALLPFTTYYWKIVANDNHGNSSTGDIWQFTTGTNEWQCGDSFTINHIAGNVAPVNKTVTYGTVTNIPGETTKCWITSNLGADHQATSVDDNTEASAGWYWKFNRQQGYKHTGTVRTPNTTWITSIVENSDWTSSNDPCSIELGNDWRIPTYTEWNNVDAVGGWTTWNEPWNSALKMHAAGYLEYSDGSLSYRGTYGIYWSNSQYNNSYGRKLDFGSSYCGMGTSLKAGGRSVRCIRN
jgi:hypothetical protein